MWLLAVRIYPSEARLHTSLCTPSKADIRLLCKQSVALRYKSMDLFGFASTIAIGPQYFDHISSLVSSSMGRLRDEWWPRWHSSERVPFSWMSDFQIEYYWCSHSSHSRLLCRRPPLSSLPDDLSAQESLKAVTNLPHPHTSYGLHEWGGKRSRHSVFRLMMKSQYYVYPSSGKVFDDKHSHWWYR